MFLHFVGKRLYPIDKFVKEVEKYGVNRAIPWFTAKKLKWGDKVLLAIYEKEIGAKVFGYFVVSELTFSGQNVAFSKKLNEKLDIVKEFSPNLQINRRCGVYMISKSFFVNNDIKDIIENARNIEKELNLKIKYFVGGKFYPLNETIIPDVKFSRNFIEISIPFEYMQFKRGKKEKRLNFMENYKQRKYITKADLNRRLGEFL